MAIKLHIYKTNIYFVGIQTTLNSVTIGSTSLNLYAATFLLRNPSIHISPFVQHINISFSGFQTCHVIHLDTCCDVFFVAYVDKKAVNGFSSVKCPVVLQDIVDLLFLLQFIRPHRPVLISKSFYPDFLCEGANKRMTFWQVLENFSDAPMTPKQILHVIQTKGLKEMR